MNGFVPFRSALYGFIILAVCVCPTPGLTQDTYGPGVGDCAKISCVLTPQQVLALAAATVRYKIDMPKVSEFGAYVGVVEEGIEVTILPRESDPTVYRGKGEKMAITYIYDTTGTKLKKMSYNR